MRVGRVLDDPQGLPEAALVAQLLQTGQLTANDGLGCTGHSAQGLLLLTGGTPLPGGEAACQQALCGASAVF